MQFAQIIEFIGNHWELVLALIVILLILGYDIVAGNRNSIDPLEAVSVINHDNALVIDVRSIEEFVNGHVIHSLNIPLNLVLKQLSTLEKHKERPIIMICNSGARSAQACRQLLGNGFAKVYNLRGGILAWENAGLPITRKNH
ncbi:membrane protein [Achromatium sp. WMS2]|nr:membrane protein [Achromatium sp. WMS2]